MCWTGHWPAEGVYWGLGSGLSQLSRAEPGFHAHNDGRVDVYPHISLPLVAGGWSLVPEAALRGTYYSGSQVPDLTGTNSGIPIVSHDPMHRTYGEAAVDLRPPALERDFALNRWHQELRHVIEPELYWHYVGGIGSQARNVLLVDTTDIETDTDEVGYSLTPALLPSPHRAQPCAESDADAEDASGDGSEKTTLRQPREGMGQLADRPALLPQSQLRRRAHSRPPQCLLLHPRFDRRLLPDRAEQPLAADQPHAL